MGLSEYEGASVSVQRTSCGGGDTSAKGALSVRVWQTVLECD